MLIFFGNVFVSFFKKFFNLFIDLRERGRWEWGRERQWDQCQRETSIGCPHKCPNRGLNPQPRYVPWPGIKPPTFFSVRDDTPTNWATPSRAHVFLIINISLFIKEIVLSVIHMSNIFFSFLLNLIMTVFNINKFINILFIDSKFQVVGQKIYSCVKNK